MHILNGILTQILNGRAAHTGSALPDAGSCLHFSHMGDVPLNCLRCPCPWSRPPLGPQGSVSSKEPAQPLCLWGLRGLQTRPLTPERAQTARPPLFGWALGLMESPTETATSPCCFLARVPCPSDVLCQGSAGYGQGPELPILGPGFCSVRQVKAGGLSGCLWSVVAEQAATALLGAGEALESGGWELTHALSP